MKFFISCTLVVFYCMTACSQSGITLYAGSSYARSSDVNMTPSGTSHTGFVAGANLRMLDDGMCFLFTGEYGRFNLMARDKVDFTHINKDLPYFKGKFGIGKDVMKLGKHAKLRTKFQGNILYILKFDRSLANLTPAMRETGYNELNEAIGGLSTGIGATIKFIDLDIEFEKGFFNIYHKMKQTTMDFFTITAGIRI